MRSCSVPPVASDWADLLPLSVQLYIVYTHTLAIVSKSVSTSYAGLLYRRSTSSLTESCRPKHSLCVLDVCLFPLARTLRAEAVLEQRSALNCSQQLLCSSVSDPKHVFLCNALHPSSCHSQTFVSVNLPTRQFAQRSTQQIEVCSAFHTTN
jgi:hypothetical protein